LTKNEKEVLNEHVINSVWWSIKEKWCAINLEAIKIGI